MGPWVARRCRERRDRRYSGWTGDGDLLPRPQAARRCRRRRGELHLLRSLSESAGEGDFAAQQWAGERTLRWGSSGGVSLRCCRIRQVPVRRRSALALGGTRCRLGDGRRSGGRRRRRRRLLAAPPLSSGILNVGEGVSRNGGGDCGSDGIGVVAAPSGILLPVPPCGTTAPVRGLCCAAEQTAARTAVERHVRVGERHRRAGTKLGWQVGGGGVEGGAARVGGDGGSVPPASHARVRPAAE